MRLGILQPYCFPYPGYFQLIRAVDRVILLDTVAFSRPTWINRNRLAGPSGVVPFRFPVRNCTSGTLINAIKLADPDRHRARFLRTLQTLYRRAPYYRRGVDTVTRCFEQPSDMLADLAVGSVRAMCAALGITTPLLRASGRYPECPSGAQALVLHICAHEGATSYLNPEGGRALYSAAAFRSAGTGLAFLHHVGTDYPRAGQSAYPRLSMLDALMHCSKPDLAALLGSFSIREPD